MSSNTLEKGSDAAVHRCYVTTHSEFDPKAARALQVLQELGCKGVTGVSTAVRYRIQGVTPEIFQTVSENMLAKKPINRVYGEDDFGRITEGTTFFGVEAKPGQYDDCEDYAAQITELTGKDVPRPIVRVAQMYIIDGKISRAKFAQFKRLMINPTDSQEAEPGVPQSLEQEVVEPPGIPVLHGFRSLDIPALKKVLKSLNLRLSKKDHQWIREHGDEPHAALDMLRRKMGLAMPIEDLLCIVEDYKKVEQRDPTETEIKAYDTYWSDHCRHTTFTTELLDIVLDGKAVVKNGEWVAEEGAETGTAYSKVLAYTMQALLQKKSEGENEGSQPFSLMDIALFAMKHARKEGRLEDLDESEENNAASIVVPVEFEDGHKEEWLFEFKNETHNHPTKIAPKGGAATCIGGAIRDPLSGRAYSFMAMRISATGDPRQSLKKTRKGRLSQRQIAVEAAEGNSEYGNSFGLPTIKTRAYVHPGFEAKPLELGFVGGAVKRENVVRERPQPGDLIVVVGGRTGRDGQGGATGSSKTATEKTATECGAEVQHGNPPMERKLQRFIAGSAMVKYQIKINDFGAGGFCVACGELADGVFLNLDDAPLKYQGLNGTEIFLSESQERMAVVIKAADRDAYIAAAQAENLEATVIGEVTADPRLVATWRNKEICNLRREMLTGGWAKREATASMETPTDIGAFFASLPEELKGKEFGAQWLDNLRRLSVCSQRGLQESFDSTVGANTVTDPFGGRYQLSPSEAAVAKFPVEGAVTAIAASYGYDPDLAERSPFHGALFAVVDSLARLVASGASFEKARLTLQNYFEKLGKEAMRWGKPLAAQLGALHAEIELGLAAIGGKDSMSGTEEDSETKERIDVPPTIVSMAVAPMDSRDVIPSCFQKTDSTLVYLPISLTDASTPDWGKLKQMWKAVHGASQGKKILSAHAIHSGGVAAALSEMSFGNGIGATLRENALNQPAWFTPRFGSMVVELPSGTDANSLFEGIDCIELGKTSESSEITLSNVQEPITLDRESMLTAWEEPFEEIFPTQPKDPGDGTIVQQEVFKPIVAPKAIRRNSIITPDSALWVFPGTNGEPEMGRALERAGARVDTQVFVNLTRQLIQDSLKRFAGTLRTKQIIIIPGGFSAGDQPDGSGKFIAAVLQNPQVREAFAEFLENGGLIAGICNGFQGLINACAFSDEGIRSVREDDPFLTHNKMGRFICRDVYLQVQSLLSPWMSEFERGEVLRWRIAHAEGRLINVQNSHFVNGQIPLLYTDETGAALNLYPHNPNGSEFNAAGLTDPTGQIFGCMPHPERNKDGNRFFRGAVRHFR